MSQEPNLAAAVQIVDRALRLDAEYPEDRAVVAVAALARAGMLHDPAEVARLRDMLDAALGVICNAHQKRVDYVTTDDGASPGWAEAARRWIDAYPPAGGAE